MKPLRIVLIGAALLAFASSPVSSAQAYDPTTLTASEIFRNARAAYGSLVGGSYVETQLTDSGGTEWTYVTLTHGDDYKTTVTGGGFTSAYGRYQSQAWSQDDNGIVILRSQFHDKESPNALALRHPDDPKYGVRVLGITPTQPKQYVVEINPPGGYDEFRYYDAGTWLLSQVVSYTRDRRKHVTEYGGYRKTFGEMRAYRVHSYDGNADNDTVTTIESYAPSAPDADLSIPAGHPLFSYDGAKPLQLPATFTQSGIVLRAIVNGRGLDFILDSGASGLFIDPAVAHELGLVPFGHHSITIGGGDVNMGRVRIPKMTIGGLEVDNAVFTTSPIDQPAGDARAVGLIGFDFLASGIIGIDFKQQTLTLFPRDAFDPKSLGLIDLPLQLDDGVPRTDVWIEGVHGHFMVDTGAFQMLVYHNFADKLPSAAHLTRDSEIVTVGGVMSTSVLRINDLIFGGVKYDVATAIEPNSSTFDFIDYDGLIGRDVLSNYRSYFDYADGALYVKPEL